jgi:hypothetical protein
VINELQKWQLRNLTPVPQHIKAYINLHKQSSPIRPIVSWYDAPAYNLAKLFTLIRQRSGNMPKGLNVKISVQLMEDLQCIDIDKNTRICSFDISSIYTNRPIPQEDVINIIKNSTLIDEKIITANNQQYIEPKLFPTQTELLKTNTRPCYGSSYLTNISRNLHSIFRT